MPEYYVSIEYRLKIEADDENVARVAAKLLEPAEASFFSKVTIEGTDIIAISEEDAN